jgi:hypothetical protein
MRLEAVLVMLALAVALVLVRPAHGAVGVVSSSAEADPTTGVVSTGPPDVRAARCRGE